MHARGVGSDDPMSGTDARMPNSMDAPMLPWLDHAPPTAEYARGAAMRSAMADLSTQLNRASRMIDTAMTSSRDSLDDLMKLEVANSAMKAETLRVLQCVLTKCNGGPAPIHTRAALTDIVARMLEGLQQ